MGYDFRTTLYRQWNIDKKVKMTSYQRRSYVVYWLNKKMKYCKKQLHVFFYKEPCGAVDNDGNSKKFSSAFSWQKNK